MRSIGKKSEGKVTVPKQVRRVSQLLLFISRERKNICAMFHLLSYLLKKLVRSVDNSKREERRTCARMQNGFKLLSVLACWSNVRRS